MNRAKTYEPVIERPHPVGMGIQKVYRFENDYGASIVCFSVGTYGDEPMGSYGVRAGLWELAVVKFNSEDNNDFTLTDDDIEGWLDDEAVEKRLAEIEARPRGES